MSVCLRRGSCTLSKTHRIEKREEEVQVRMTEAKLNLTFIYLFKNADFSFTVLPHQYDSVHNNNASSDLTQKADATDNQDVHYSNINLKTKHPSSIPTDEYPTDNTDTETVYYATVMFK